MPTPYNGLCHALHNAMYTTVPMRKFNIRLIANVYIAESLAPLRSVEVSMHVADMCWQL